MFRDRVREILKTVDYDLINYNYDTMVINDRKNNDREIVFDLYELPCSFISDKQDRKVVCVNNDRYKYIRVRYTNIDRDGYTSFLDITSKQTDKLDYYVCEFEDDGKLFYFKICGDGCNIREMDISDGKMLITELELSEDKVKVSRKLGSNSEKIELTKDGYLSLYRNNELLEKAKINDNIRAYSSSVISTVDPIIESCISYLYECNHNLISLMSSEYGYVLKSLFQHKSDCYETDFIDGFLRKHDIFIHENSINCVK